MTCNATREACTPESVFAASASPQCSQFFNPVNFQAEQLVYDAAFKDLINSYGVPINYYVNTFNIAEADRLYGEQPTSQFAGPYTLQMYLELTENAINLSKFGFASDDELTGFLHIETFTTALCGVLDYSSFNQVVEPKSGDIIELITLGCDRPNGRGAKWFEITERVDQDVASLNPAQGHYVYRVKAKRYEHSFEPGLSGERANEQVYENSFTGILSTNIPGVSSSADKSYDFNINTESQTQVFDMTANNTDIYGTYY